MKLRVLLGLAGALVLLGSISLVRTTASQGTDFAVFWNTIQHLFHSEPLYSTARDGGMVFKYPPWIIPFLIPFGLLPLDWAKWAWGFVELGSLFYIVRWVHLKLRTPAAIWFPVLISYWGLWIVHALDGQISLVMLAVALGCGDIVRREPDSAGEGFRGAVYERVKITFLFVALSTKIFTLFPLLAFQWNRRHFRSLFYIAGVCLLLSLPAFHSQSSQGTWISTSGVISTLSSWVDAAGSAGHLLTSEQVRGRYNPGLPSYFLKRIGVPPSQTGADLFTALVMAFGLGAVWRSVCRRVRLTPREEWLGWLALTPVVHPLPWWHLFVFTFPMTVWVVDRVWTLGQTLPPARSRGARILCILGVFLICFSTEKLWGTFGLILELNAAKSWGVLCGLLALVWVKSGLESVPEAEACGVDPKSDRRAGAIHLDELKVGIVHAGRE